MSNKESDKELYQDDFLLDAFNVTGQVGYLLLHDEIAKLNNLPENKDEDPRFR